MIAAASCLSLSGANIRDLRLGRGRGGEREEERGKEEERGREGGKEKGNEGRRG